MAKKKSKRKMPAHIVLPNGMWRFVSSKAKRKVKSTFKRKFKIKHKKRRVSNMVKRRRTYRRYSGMGGGKLMNGFIKPRGMIAAALLGIAAAELVKNAPQVIPYQDKVAAFAVGGVPAVGGALLKETISGRSLSGSSGLFNY